MLGIIKIDYQNHQIIKKKNHSPTTPDKYKKIMAYHKKNHYKKIAEMQEIVKKLKFEQDMTYKEIYYQVIESRYHISLRTYHTWLGIPASRELKKMENPNQLKFDF